MAGLERIDPVHRRRYMFATRDLLKKGGKFLAIWWIGERHGEGLPFSVSRDEIDHIYQDCVRLSTLAGYIYDEVEFFDRIRLMNRESCGKCGVK